MSVVALAGGWALSWGGVTVAGSSEPDWAAGSWERVTAVGLAESWVLQLLERGLGEPSVATWAMLSAGL